MYVNQIKAKQSKANSSFYTKLRRGFAHFLGHFKGTNNRVFSTFILETLMPNTIVFAYFLNIMELRPPLLQTHTPT